MSTIWSLRKSISKPHSDHVQRQCSSSSGSFKDWKGNVIKSPQYIAVAGYTPMCDLIYGSTLDWSPNCHPTLNLRSTQDKIQILPDWHRRIVIVKLLRRCEESTDSGQGQGVETSGREAKG